MRKASEHNPRKGDITRDELIRQADERAAEGWTVYFKFTCAYCGERCMFQEPNSLYESGECAGCGKETIVDVGGLSLQMEVPSGNLTGEEENN